MQPTTKQGGRVWLLALILILNSHTVIHAQQQPSGDSQHKARPSNKASPAINQIPRLELLLALNQVDLALKQLEAAQECANAAINLANVAETHANEIELTAVARIANDLKKQLEDLITNIKDSTSSVIDTRLKAATEAPLSLLEIDISEISLLIPIPDKDSAIDKAPLETAPAATRLPTIDQQIETLSKTESSLLGPDLKNPSLSDPQLGLIRYKLADALYRKALLHIKTYKDKQAEIGIGHAIAKFLSVLDSPDSSDSGEGSSLHASALRRSIQSEAILVRGYQNLNKATAQKHASAAEQTYGLLKNSYRDARLPNGQLVVDAVRNDIDRQR